MVNPEVSAYRSSRGSPLEIRDGQLLNDFDSTQHSTTGVSMPELLFGRPIRTKLPISKSSASKMRCEIMTVREKKKGRCMQTAKGMHVKVKFKKVIRCYWDRRRKETVKSPYKQQGKWNLVSHWVQYLCTWITCPYKLNVIMIVATLACAFTWLPCHQTDLKLNTKAFVATYYAY